jgi:hypothetical protein
MRSSSVLIPKTEPRQISDLMQVRQDDLFGWQQSDYPRSLFGYTDPPSGDHAVSPFWRIAVTLYPFPYSVSPL